VQLTNPDGDFQGEVRADEHGGFVLHPVPGQWRLVAWAPGLGRTDRSVDVASADLEVQLELR
jgi:hypothetical protein